MAWSQSIRSISSRIELTTAFKQRRLPAPRDALPHHVDVFQAVAAGDAQGAHDAMAKLVDRGRADTMEAREESAGRKRASPIKAIAK